MAKRKRSTAAAVSSAANESSPTDLPRSSGAVVPRSSNTTTQSPRPPQRQSSQRVPRSKEANIVRTNPNDNPDVLDGIAALRASPDAVITGANSEVEPQLDNVSTANGVTTHPGQPALARRASKAAAYATEENIAAPPAAAIEPARRMQDRKATTVDRVPHESDTANEQADPTHDQRGSAPRKDKKGSGSTGHVKVDNAMTSNKTGAKPASTKAGKAGSAVEQDVGVTGDPDAEANVGEDVEEDEVREALSRPPPINSDYLPLPWKGRLGYACLNTYLRNANTPVFSSRTCRIASILEHRHPLKDPSQPEHATKNRPDKDQPADVARGQRFVEELGLANARDVIKMVKWNDKYGIKFMRLSSEMFPFASHDEYGYKLAPFAADTLAEVGKVIAELGHRVTTHPGQFTQLGSPRKSVIDNAIRDLEYHDEMLSLLKLPPQQDRDAVMIMHLGGAFGDKPAALDRFRENYARLSQSVKNRLVLENDDVVWSTHELLPLCQELNIPFVLDFHHHNIIFDATKIREGTKDIVEMFPEILETWKRKNITPKMHYSEPCPDAVTGRARRKHSPRVMTLPPCPDTMDLMIEAKDKEQAVFELMRTFKLPGFHLFNDVIPHVRQDENKPIKPKPKKAAKKSKKKVKKEDDDLEALDEKIEEAVDEEQGPVIVPEEEVNMGGPERRVYWPPGQEDWLRPPKRIIKAKEGGVAATPAKKRGKTTAAAATDDASVNGDVNGESVKTPAKKPAPKRAPSSKKKAAAAKTVPTPSASDDSESSPLSDLGDDTELDAPPAKKKRTAPAAPTRRKSGRAAQVSYKEEDADEMSM